MVTLQKKNVASLQKLFIIDDQGAYTGEYTVDDECVIEFDDFVKAVGNMAMEDSQTVFIGEYKATMLHGAQLSLIAISRGPLGSQELTWAKATLTAVEASLAQQSEGPAEEVDAGAAPSDSKEASPEEDSGINLDELQEKLQKVESQLIQERKSNMEKSVEVQAKEDKLREMEAAASAAKEREERLQRDIETLKADLDSAKAKIPEDIVQAQKDMEMRVKLIQKKAFELLEREEKLRKREQELSKVVASE